MDLGNLYDILETLRKVEGIHGAILVKYEKGIVSVIAESLPSWIDAESRKLDKAFRFFELAKKLGLVKNGHYIDGIPKGDEDLVNEFYSLEDYLEYPEPQIINTLK